MCPRDFARRKCGPAADHGRVRQRMVGRPERRPPPELGDRALAGRRRDDRDGEGGRVVEGRHQAWDRPREERLADPRRPTQHQAVSAGDRDLQRATRLGLAAYLGEIRDHVQCRDRRSIGFLAGGPDRSGDRDSRHGDDGPLATAAADHLRCLGQARDPDHLDPIHETRLVHGAGGHHDPLDPASRDGRDHRQDAWHGPDVAVEAQLADETDRGAARADLFRSEQDAECDGQIQRGTGLAQLRGGEVHRDPPRRKGEPGIPNGAANPFPRLLDRSITEADDREPRQAWRDVDLDADRPAVEAMQRCGWDDGQHAVTLPGAAHPGLICRSPRANHGRIWTRNVSGRAPAAASRRSPPCPRRGRTGGAMRRAVNRPS
jgi:hypothetical protein